MVGDSRGETRKRAEKKKDQKGKSWHGKLTDISPLPNSNKLEIFGGWMSESMQ